MRVISGISAHRRRQFCHISPEQGCRLFTADSRADSSALAGFSTVIPRECLGRAKYDIFGVEEGEGGKKGASSRTKASSQAVGDGTLHKTALDEHARI
ncbi:hypothetical protein HYQ46_008792 [Verticillium longisporum]|nr:hypothetical protein HYQ46_008792 [Verticillium longisporum]